MTTTGGFNLDDLIAEFGAYYVDNGQAEKDIKNQMFYTDDLSKFFAKAPQKGNIFRGVQLFSTEVLQGFLKAFVSKGTGNFKTWTQKLGEFKIDKSEDPDDYANMWAGFLSDLNEVDRSKWPIIYYIINKVLMPQSQQDFIREVAYWGYQFTGVGNGGVDNTGTLRETPAEDDKLKANTSMDGLRIQFVKMAAASRLNTITLGALETDPADFVTQIEDFVKQIPDLLKGQMDNLFMSTALRTRYREGVQQKYNVNYKGQADLDAIFDSNMTVVGTAAQGGSSKIWCTPAINRVRAIRADQAGRFDVQKADRRVKMLNNWSYVLTFHQPELIVTNELENTIANGEITGGGRYATTIAS